MTWEMAYGLVVLIFSHLGVEIYRRWSGKSRDRREQLGISATTQLTELNAKKVAEEVQAMQLDRFERLHAYINERDAKLRELQRKSDEDAHALTARVEALEEDLEVADMEHTRTITRALAGRTMGLGYISELREKWPTPDAAPPHDPPPDYPPGWHAVQAISLEEGR